MKKFAVVVLALLFLSGCVSIGGHNDRSTQIDQGNSSAAAGTSYTSAKEIRSAQTTATTAPRPAPINHVVFFKLTDASKADALVADCDRLLSGIPTVTSYFCGKHLDTGRDSVDDAYDVGLYVGFGSKEGYSTYLTHPDHLALVAKWGPDFAEVQVRDVYDGTP